MPPLLQDINDNKSYIFLIYKYIIIFWYYWKTQHVVLLCISKYYKKDNIINTWNLKKQRYSNKYINLYILPIVFTFGFTGNNAFKNLEVPLYTSEQRCFIKKIDNRLPKYIKYFKKHTRNSIFSWELIAAISYQESHWNHKAVSKTKVKGLMMLTKDTASYIGVKNRLDPNQSVYGGVRYLENIFKRLPSSIVGSDRIWMTLAAYNVGLGHLEDARIITQRFGYNPNYWSDVKKHLPLLRLKKFYKKTKYGYARGNEPVKYVKRIQAYLNIIHEDKKTYLASLSPKKVFND